MNPHDVLSCVSRRFLFGIVPLLGLTGCSGTDQHPDNTIEPQIPFVLPVLPLPGLAFEPRITSEDPTARQAAAIVAGQRNMIPYMSRDCEAAVSMLNAGAWVEAGGACWSKQLAVDPGRDCSYTMHVCLDGERLDWTEVIDGTCPAGFGMAVYDHWIRLHAVSGDDARTGAFRVYRSGTDLVELAWTWNLRADPPTGDWEFFRGQIDVTAPIAHLTWSRSSDTTEVAQWSWVGYAKWESEVASDGRTGLLTAHRWDASRRQWRELHEIHWAVGHGTWATFDSAGVVQDERSW